MKVIAIDPGHGLPDPGAVGNGLKEADITLTVSWRLARLLVRNGVDVVITRPFPNMLIPKSGVQDRQKRALIANQVDAHRFVSIHCNSAENPSATGHEVFYHNNSPLGMALASRINKAIAERFPNLRNRGVKSDFTLHERGLQVLRQTRMPAVLVELAFISNPEDALILADNRQLDRMAEAICAGILEDLQAA